MSTINAITVAKKRTRICHACNSLLPKLLQPIPIPSQPFKVVSMDFIPELPTANGFNNILVIVDKLTKYAIIIPTTTKVNKVETTRLFFKHVVSKFRIPRQVISDRDTRWRGDFWKEICQLMGMRQSLTMSYHPQANGQTEVLNQGLEFLIRAYISPDRDNWSKIIDALTLSYNSSPHTATGFSPAYLLRGFHPITSSTILGQSSSIDWTKISDSGNVDQETIHDKVLDLVEGFAAERAKARDALLLGQLFQKKEQRKIELGIWRRG